MSKNNPNCACEVCNLKIDNTPLYHAIFEAIEKTAATTTLHFKVAVMVLTEVLVAFLAWGHAHNHLNDDELDELLDILSTRLSEEFPVNADELN